LPGEAWETTSVAETGWDAAKLDEALSFAGSRATRALILLLQGRILAEHYYDVGVDYRREIASCQKSVVSVLVGCALDRDLLALDEPVTTYVGRGWSNASASQEDRITVRHLLSMTSGLDAEFRSVAAPGEVWSYNNGVYHQLQPVLEAVTKTGIDELSEDWLWRPIGATASAWYERNGQGEYATDAMGRALWGLSMSARDMARFGLLVQRGGAWGDEAVLADETYLDTALASSSEANPSYGYLWWLNGKSGHRVGPSGSLQPGPLIPHAPADTVAALGRDDQKIYISRSTGLVLVRQGERGGTRGRETLSSFDTELWGAIMDARLA
jgi:CubicO group peptidase (beta-lactamase class C family)